ncbi:K02A2.6-like, partial [Cordylochernes scorpioides]
MVYNPYSPQANGLIERLNATITGKLRLAYLENPKASWTQLVKRVTQTYNNKPHSVTSFPPTYLMFNIIPPDLRTHLNPYPEVNIAREIANSRTQNKHKKDKETFDKQHRTPHFEVNDLVLVKNYRHPDTGKLAPYFTGPHKIIEIISPNVVRIDRPNQPLNRDSDTIHVNKLKYYTENVLYITPPQPRFVQNPQRLPQNVYLSEFNHLTPDILETQLFRIIPHTSSQPFLHLNPVSRMATNLIRAESPSNAKQKPVRHGAKAQPCAELSEKDVFQKKTSNLYNKNQNYANPPAGGHHANPATPTDFVTASFSEAAAQANRSWADLTEDNKHESEDPFITVQRKKRRRGSAESPAAAAPSSGTRGAGATRRPRSSTGWAPRAEEVRTTQAHIAEARARQASSTEDHCVYVERSPELEPYHYIRAIDRMFGSTREVFQVTKMNGHFLVGLANKSMAERLVNEGLEVEGTLHRAFPFRKRAERITVGNLPFFVGDAAVISALSSFGRVISSAPKLMKAGPYVYNDGRREAFIIFREGMTIERLPTRLDITIKGEAWPAYLSTGIRCSRCRGQGHRRANCPLLAGRTTEPGPATPSSTTSVPPATAPKLPQQPSAQPPPLASHSPAMEVSDVPPASRAALLPPAALRPSPPAPLASPAEAAPPAPPPVTPAPSLRTPGSREPAAPTPDIEMSNVEESPPPLSPPEPAAVPPTPPLPAPQPAGPIPPAPDEEEMTPIMREECMVIEIFKKLKHLTCLRPLYQSGIQPDDLKDAILFIDERESLMARLTPAMRGVLAEFLSTAIEPARGNHPDVSSDLATSAPGLPQQPSAQPPPPASPSPAMEVSEVPSTSRAALPPAAPRQSPPVAPAIPTEMAPPAPPPVAPAPSLRAPGSHGPAVPTLDVEMSIEETSTSRAALKTSPAAVPPTPPLPAPQPAGPIPPAPDEEEMTPIMREECMVIEIFKKLKHLTCLRPLYQSGIQPNDIKDAILFIDERESLMARLTPAMRGVLAEFLSAAIEPARGNHPDVSSDLTVLGGDALIPDNCQ